MLTLRLLENNNENISLPSHKGDVGHDMRFNSVTIVGKSINNGEESIRIISNDELKKICRDRYWANIKYLEYDTGVKYELVQDHTNSERYFGGILPRSSNSKKNLYLKNHLGVVDLGYRGTVRFRYGYVFQPEDLIVKIPEGFLYGQINFDEIYQLGEKCGQMIFLSYTNPIFQIVDKLEDTARSEGGFGSTGV